MRSSSRTGAGPQQATSQGSAATHIKHNNPEVAMVMVMFHIREKEVMLVVEPNSIRGHKAASRSGTTPLEQLLGSWE